SDRPHLIASAACHRDVLTHSRYFQHELRRRYRRSGDRHALHENGEPVRSDAKVVLSLVDPKRERSGLVGRRRRRRQARWRRGFDTGAGNCGMTRVEHDAANRWLRGTTLLTLRNCRSTEDDRTAKEEDEEPANGQTHDVSLLRVPNQPFGGVPPGISPPWLGIETQSHLRVPRLIPTGLVGQRSWCCKKCYSLAAEI